MVPFFIGGKIARPVHLVMDVLLVAAMRAPDDVVVLHPSIIRTTTVHPVRLLKVTHADHV